MLHSFVLKRYTSHIFIRDIITKVVIIRQKPDSNKGRDQPGYGPAGAADLPHAHGGVGAEIDRSCKRERRSGRVPGRYPGYGAGAGADLMGQHIFRHFRYRTQVGYNFLFQRFLFLLYSHCPVSYTHLPHYYVVGVIFEKKE